MCSPILAFSLIWRAPFGQFVHSGTPQSYHFYSHGIICIGIYSNEDDNGKMWRRARFHRFMIYPAIRAAIADDELMAESLEEHHVWQGFIKELKKMKPSGNRYDAKFTVLVETSSITSKKNWKCSECRRLRHCKERTIFSSREAKAVGCQPLRKTEKQELEAALGFPGGSSERQGYLEAPERNLYKMD
jgi:hypothetical protein